MYRVLQILTVAEVAQCRQIATSAPFIEGRISKPHNTAKQNEQLHDPQAYQKSSGLRKTALARSPELMEFAFPVALAPPMMIRSKPGMKYGAHGAAVLIRLPTTTI